MHSDGDDEEPVGLTEESGYSFVAPQLNDPRFRLTAVTMTLQVLGQVAFNFNLSIAQILVSLITAGLIEFVIRARRERVIAWPASALLSGNGVALILRVPGTEHGDWWSLRGWYIFAGVSAAAVVSKYVIRWRGKHVFNPSNLALVVAFVILGEQRVDPQILWWGPWSVPIGIAFAVILVGSFAITQKVGQMPTAISFWVVFSLLIGAAAASGHAITTNWHVGPLSGWAYWLTLVTSPEVLVFLFFMITDPKTSPRTPTGKAFFGGSIALVSALIVSTQTGEFGTKVGILAGLVVMCPFASLMDRVALPARDQVPAIAEPDGESLPARRPAPVGGLPVTPRFAGMAMLVIVVALPAVYLAAGKRTFVDPAGTATGADMSWRDDFNMDGVELPKVRLDPEATRSAFSLTPELADQIGADVATDLFLEAEAIATQDAGLLEVATAAGRLDQMTDAVATIKKSGTPPPGRVNYRFRTLTVTQYKKDDGPQTPPELAVHIEGDAVTGQQKQIKIDDTFTVTNVDGTYLISGQYDSQHRSVPSAAIADLDEAISPGVPSGPGQPGGPPKNVLPATPEELSGLRLTDRSAELGLNLPMSRYDLGEQQNFRIGGAAVGDFDNDGWPDVFLSRVGYPNVLLRNEQGRFADVTAASGLGNEAPMTPVESGSTAAAFVDLDGDSNLDLLVLGMAGTPNRLYLGDGAGHFTDATRQWALPDSPAPTSASLQVGIAVSDIDQDGDLDVLLVSSERDHIEAELRKAKIDNKKICSTEARAAIDQLPKSASHTVLLRNEGGHFEDATSALGVDPWKVAASSARFVDVNGDGRDDLVLGADNCTSKLLVNVGGRFEDRTVGSGFEKIARMNSIAATDINRDGRIDLLATGISYPSKPGDCALTKLGQGCDGNHLLLGEGDGKFRDASEQYGVKEGDWAWGAVAEDLNNDSSDDLFVANGTTNVETWLGNRGRGDEASPIGSLSGTTNIVLLGAPKAPMRWVDTSTWTGFSPDDKRSSARRDGRAVITADFNRDGKPDLLVVNAGAPPTLLMNETGNDNRWLDVQVIDSNANRFAVGAVVIVELSDGVELTRRLGVEGSYQSGGPSAVHFGIGASRTVRKVTVTSVTGTTRIVEDPQVNQLLTVRMGVTR